MGLTAPGETSMLPPPVKGLNLEKKFESPLEIPLRDGGARLPSTGPTHPGCLKESFPLLLRFLLPVPTLPAHRLLLLRLFFPAALRPAVPIGE